MPCIASNQLLYYQSYPSKKALLFAYLVAAPSLRLISANLLSAKKIVDSAKSEEF